MGTNAVYISIDDSTLDDLWKRDNQEFRDRFLEIEEDEKFERVDIAKIWDALHCTLTGATASNPIEDNKVSEAIVGIYPKIFEDEDYSLYVSVMDNENLPELIEVIKEYDIEKMSVLFDPKLLEAQKVYPQGIWHEKSELLIQEMNTALESIRNFFIKTNKTENHIISTFI